MRKPPIRLSSALLCVSVAMIVFFSATATAFANEPNPASDFKYKVKDAGVFITSYKGEPSDVIIPAKIKGKPVVSVTIASADSHVDTLGFEVGSEVAGIDLFSSALSALDVTNCPKLKKLDISYNCISDLDLSKNTNLEELYSRCGEGRWLVPFPYCNYLHDLDLSANRKLKKLELLESFVPRIDLSNNTKLTHLYYGGDEEAEPLDISMLSKLQVLHLEIETLKKLDVTPFPDLRKLALFGSKVSTLDLTKTAKLTSLDCEGSPITSISIGSKPRLKEFVCRYSALEKIALTKCPKLETVDVGHSKLKALTIISPKLDQLDCNDNILTSLNLKKCPNLRSLDCSKNKLKSLDLTSCTGLDEVYVKNNPMSRLKLGKGAAYACVFYKNTKLTSSYLKKIDNKLGGSMSLYK